jgi:hypothetical protein
MSTHLLAPIRDALLEIDHLLICLQSAPDRSALQSLGLVCNVPLVPHPQQGTVSQLIFFETCYLELIWVDDAAMATTYAMRSGIDFVARSQWQQTQASPFGIVLRQASNPPLTSNRLTETLTANGDREEMLAADSGTADLIEPQSLGPQSSRRAVSPPEVPAFVNFAASNLAEQTEPFCFVIPETATLTQLLAANAAAREQFTTHSLGMRQLTHTRLTLSKAANWTSPIAMLIETGVVEVQPAASPQLDLTFDRGAQQRCLDLRSLGIPVLLRY